MKLAAVIALLIASFVGDDTMRGDLLLVAICCAILACAPPSQTGERFWRAVERERDRTDSNDSEGEAP